MRTKLVLIVFWGINRARDKRYSQNQFLFNTLQNNKKGHVSGFVGDMPLPTEERRI